MAYTAQDLAAIDSAIVALTLGERVTEIRFTDRLVKYQEVTADELRKLRAEIVRQLGPQRVPLSGRTWACTQGGKGL
ncbi:hypothetical protein [Bordetella hinzii]|uniref:hypothetical protein n=1 Tax=Bordetella hinzii TaxID=103855 RepID=UPI0007648EF7|nr:hypothetical protein [Bordetella hinzii]KXA71067.1 hypothetical protein AXA74_20405 [Bordetella hinzii LMG 13501]VEH23176.1 Uncharacterised protein [Bordetella hinzii]